MPSSLYTKTTKLLGSVLKLAERVDCSCASRMNNQLLKQTSGTRLSVESFVNLQPRWRFRLGLVPYWAAFNDQTFVEKLHRDLDTTQPYDEIYVNLYSNSNNSVGLASVEQWRSVINQALHQGDFIGVNKKRYPRDLASSIRHYTELKKLSGLYPLPEPLKLYQLDDFLVKAGDRYPARWSTIPF